MSGEEPGGQEPGRGGPPAGDPQAADSARGDRPFLTEEPRKPSLLFRLMTLGAGSFVGLIGSFIACLFAMGMIDRLGSTVALVVGGALLIVGPLGFLLWKRPRAPFVIGLTLGVTLTGLLMGACGTLMR